MNENDYSEDEDDFSDWADLEGDGLADDEIKAQSQLDFLQRCYPKRWSTGQPKLIFDQTEEGRAAPMVNPNGGLRGSRATDKKFDHLRGWK